MCLCIVTYVPSAPAQFTTLRGTIRILLGGIGGGGWKEGEQVSTMV